MKVSALIIEKLLNDKIFRLNTALALNVTERNVQERAKLNSDNLTKMAAVNYYRSTGLSDDQIFAPDGTTAFIKKIQDDQMTKSEKASR